MRSKLTLYCIAGLITLGVTHGAKAQEQVAPRAASPFTRKVRLQTGELAPAGAKAWFSQGPWSDDASPFDPVADHRGEYKIAVYSRFFDKKTADVAKAIEAVINDDPALQRSFMMIDRTFVDSTKSSMTDARASLKMRAMREGVERLSIGYYYNPGNAVRSFKQLQIFGDSDLVIMLISPSIAKGSYPTIAFVETLKQSEITHKAIQRIVEAVKSKRADAKNRITPVD